MANSSTYSCQCGQVTAEISPIGPEKGNHLICYCRDCRAYARYLGQAGRMLDDAGGSDIYQVMPNQIKDLKGAEHLTYVQLTEDGVFRWYTSCCNTAFANTLPTAKFPLAGFPVINLSNVEDFGPIIAQVSTQEATTPVEAFGRDRVMKRTLKKVALQKAAAQWKRTPFFDPKTDTPVATRTEVSADALKAAYTD